MFVTLEVWRTLPTFGNDLSWAAAFGGEGAAARLFC